MTSMVSAPADLKNRREKLRLSQFELATLAGVSPRTIFRIESGETPTVRQETGKKIEQVLSGGPQLSNRVDYLEADELEALSKIAREMGGRLTFQTVSQIISNRRANITAPK